MTRTADFPRINPEGSMLALRAIVRGFTDKRIGQPWKAENLAHEFSDLVRMAKRHTSIQVARCNRPMTPADETREKNLRIRIRAKVRELFQIPPIVEFGGDPRGHTVSIRWGAPESGTEWGIA